MAYISGEYTSATEYTITLGGMDIGTVYAILVQDINTDGSSNGFICKWKSGATSSTHTVKYTTTAVYSQYERRIGFFQGSFNTNVGTTVSDTNFDAWADGESVIEAWSGGGGGTTYTIAVNANGGTYSGPTPTVSSSYPYLSLTAISNSTSRSGHKLTGWLWSVDGVVYTTEATITGISSSGTLTAQWEYNGNYYYRIRVSANGGKFSDGSSYYWWPVDDVASSTSQAPTVKTSEFETPTRTGYRFVGWSSSSSATSGAAYIAFKATSTDADNPTTGNNVYAIWQISPTVTLNANGGVFQDTRQSTRSIPNQTPGDIFYFSSYSDLVTRDGYKVIGWSASSSATSPTYERDGYVSIGSSATYVYYAVWQKTRVTITLYGNGGLWGGNLQKRTLTKNVGETVSFAEYGPNGTPPLLNAYHTLSGWSTSATGTAAWDVDGYVTAGATDADYYAIWKNHIDPFYWDGGSGTRDSSIIATGLPVSNITAERWNRLKAKVKEISTAKGVTYSYTEVSKGDAITSTEYNGVRNAIYNVPGHGTLPPAKARNTQILASLFNGTQSLKSALNAAIISYNNS